jgi:hypothetical protein
MRAKEITSKGKPQVYLDLDGVVADFFDKYAELAIIHLMMEKYGKSEQEAFAIYHKDEERWQKEFGIQSYRDIPPVKGDPVLNMMIGTEFFNKLPKFPTADTLVSYLVDTFGEYTVLSSPLRGDFENSEKWKKVWVARELNPPPKAVIIEHRKEKYAKQADGTPNVLIDDRGNNITKWEAKGGVGVKYQADENGLDTVYKGVERAFKIIKGEEEHVPQVLKSIDRTQTIATGDDEKKEVKENIADNKEMFVAMFQKFLPLAAKILDLKNLPAMKFELNVNGHDQPTFGKYDYENNVLHVALGNRHPNDILRTVAHELVHHKQGTEYRLDNNSGETGSGEENEANALAGVIMRHFNKQYPEFLKQKPIIAERRKSKKKKRRWAAYGPGPYGWYGYDAGYSGDSGGGDGGVGESISPDDIHNLADQKGVEWDNEPNFLAQTKRLTGKAHLDDLDQAGLKKVKAWLMSVDENFADGKGPGRPGDSRRHGIPKKATLSQLDKIGKGGGRKAQLARWQANMRRGRAKKK